MQSPTRNPLKLNLWISHYGRWRRSARHERPPAPTVPRLASGRPNGLAQDLAASGDRLAAAIEWLLADRLSKVRRGAHARPVDASLDALRRIRSHLGRATRGQVLIAVPACRAFGEVGRLLVSLSQCSRGKRQGRSFATLGAGARPRDRRRQRRRLSHRRQPLRCRTGPA